jgi:Putative rRNA methylase
MTDPMSALPTAVQWSHVLLAPRLRAGDIVVDATAGNGHDSLFLAKAVLPRGHVFVFDLQAAAIESTRQRLDDSGFSSDQGLTLIHAGHEEMSARIPAEFHGRIKVIMFNLGFLPGGDKNVITRTGTTMSALAQATALIAEDGILTVVAYPGHEGGDEEGSAIEAWMQTLSSTEFEVQKLAFLNFRATTPFVMWLRKRSARPPHTRPASD